MTGAEVYIRFNRLKFRLIILTGLVFILFLLGLNQRPFSYLLRAVGQDNTVVDEYIDVSETLSHLSWQDDEAFREQINVRRNLLKEISTRLDEARVNFTTATQKSGHDANRVALFPRWKISEEKYQKLNPAFWQDARMREFVLKVSVLMSEGQGMDFFNRHEDVIGVSRLEALTKLNKEIEKRLESAMQLISKAYPLEKRRQVITDTFSVVIEATLLILIITTWELVKIWSPTRNYVLNNKEPEAESRKDIWESEIASVMYIVVVVTLFVLFSYRVLGITPFDWISKGILIKAPPSGSILIGGLLILLAVEFGRAILNWFILQLKIFNKKID